MSTTEKSSGRRFASPWVVPRNSSGPALEAMPLAVPEPELICDIFTEWRLIDLGAGSAEC